MDETTREGHRNNTQAHLAHAIDHQHNNKGKRTMRMYAQPQIVHVIDQWIWNQN